MEVKSARPTSAPQPVQPSRRAEEAKQAAQLLESRNQSQQSQKASEPKPVVNTQGQQTGRLLNVTA